jgi:predicted nuclease with RNAse H fold
VRALGIDVGVRKGLDLVLLDDRSVADTARRVRVEELGRLMGDLDPDIVAIDAPPRWALRNGGSRETEQQIRLVGIQCFGTPSRDRKDHPFYGWMRVGFDVFKVAARQGFGRYSPPGSPRHTAIEVFPHASAVVLAGCLPPRSASRGRPKYEWRRRVLAACGVDVGDLRSPDQVDSALAALTGLYALEGRCFAPGDPREGVIVLPAATLPPPPFRRSPEPESPESGQMVLRGLARCRCGDPDCTASTAREFAPGHDAKRKSVLWALARSGQEAAEELGRRGWELPPEMR